MSVAVDNLLPISVCSWQFNVSTLPNESKNSTLVQEVTEWAGKSKSCLYYFQCDTSDIDLDKIKQNFTAARDRAYSRLNAKSQFIYVGSSRSLSKRFKEHLGYGPHKTYALHLIHWARPLSLQLEFICAKYAENTDSGALEALEDTLWKTKLPMFGRQGRK